MSRFNLAKKLSPTKKAWKSFKTTFQSKLQKLNTSNAIKRTKKYCINTLNSIRVFIPRKLQALINCPLLCCGHHFHHYHQHRNCSSAIYVDELFPRHASLMHASHSSTLAQPPQPMQMATSDSSYGNNAKFKETTSNVVKQHHQIAAPGVKIPEKKNKDGKPSTGALASAAADAWKIPFLPELRCVDERAEEFISKFRQEMNLEREQSIIDFQEMLARGT